MKIAVVLHEERNYVLQAFAPDDRSKSELERLRKANRGILSPRAQPMDEVTLLPGLNYVDKSLVERAGFTPDTGNVVASFRDVGTMSRRERTKLASETVSRAALLTWLANEKDEQVKIAIKKKLGLLQADESTN